MANIAASPFVLKDAVLKVGSDNFEASVSQVEITPTNSTTTWAGLTPTAVFSAVGASTWAVTFSGAQDWEDEDSLANLLLDGEGDTETLDFYPVNGGAGFRVTVTLVAPQIGGTVNGVPVFTVTLPVQGKPARIVTP
jgi:hypothetical protein